MAWRCWVLTARRSRRRGEVHPTHCLIFTQVKAVKEDKEVIDFLNVHLMNGYVWPSFNVADSLIVVGTIILMFEVFTGEAPSSEQEEKEPLPPRG